MATDLKNSNRKSWKIVLGFLRNKVHGSFQVFVELISCLNLRVTTDFQYLTRSIIRYLVAHIYSQLGLSFSSNHRECRKKRDPKLYNQIWNISSLVALKVDYYSLFSSGRFYGKFWAGYFWRWCPLLGSHFLNFAP